MMEIFDTHFHLPEKDSIAGFEVMQQEHLHLSEEALTLPGNSFKLYTLAAGGDHADSIAAMEYANSRSNCYFSCGVHPHQADNYLKTQESFECFRGVSKLAAIGEIGLDYFYEESERSGQLQVFEKFLAMALRWDLPAMLHLRDKDGETCVYTDALERLRPFAAAGGRFVIHCCTVDVEHIAEFLELGAFIGVTGMVTFKRAQNVRDMLKKVPLDRILLETDSPYLAPVPYRGRENTPGLLPLAAQYLAMEREMTLEDICRITTANAKRLYLDNKEN